ncbi:MAG TPA: TGS domain-containing protein, partial [Vicingus sp.]|nr:TGS domain-containing protein [Vicingus sp.]
MIKVTLPDGAIKEFPKGCTPMDIALSISEGLARNVISAKVNDTTVEVTTPITTDAKVTLFTFDQEEGKKAFWHSSAHILAQALEKLYPGIKLTIGPAIESGFYYDVDSPTPIRE